MRASTLLSAALLLLISPALAAPLADPVDKRQGEPRSPRSTLTLQTPAGANR